MAANDEAQRALAYADAAFARRDVPAVVAHLSAAIRELTAAGDVRSAAVACARLGDVYASAMGNLTVGRAWFGRARRLIADEPPCIEQGWVAIAAMGCDVNDPAALLADAELALDRARRFGDVNLETKALADGGLARVQAGRMAEGMAMLDEAMALACGPADDGDTAAKSVCSFFTACYVTGDFERAGSWTVPLNGKGLLGRSSPNTVFLSSHCDTVQAALLVEMGRWGEAEAMLVAAKHAFEQGMGTDHSWHPDIGLADLRLRQGRLTDAESLLIGKDQAVHALLPMAQLQLARGDVRLARTLARRGLRVIADDRVRAIDFLVVMVDIELAAGDLAAARRVSAELESPERSIELASVQARASRARARVLAAGGDVDDAIGVLEAAVDDLDPVRAGWLRTSLLIEIARLRERSGDVDGAAVDAAEVDAALARLDVVVAPSVHELLARLTGPLPTSPAPVAILGHDGKWWTVSSGHDRVRLPDTKGLRYLAELISGPGIERHALDLVDRVEGVDPDGLDRRQLGDAGEHLDFTARAAYRRRIESLRAEADEAIESGMFDRAEGLQDELDLLVAQLAAAFGLGGGERRAASACERARLNVTRAIRAAIVRLREALPEAGAALDRGVRTGMYCVYRPVDDELRWIVRD